MADKPAQLYIAMEMSFPGCWGSSSKGPHHAIAEACDEGADRENAFQVFDAYEGCWISEMGTVAYLVEFGEPPIYGIYDAAGNLLGNTVEDACEQARDGCFYSTGTPAVSKKTIEAMKTFKSE